MLSQHYQRMAPADLSRDILQLAPGLGVVPVIGSGWFDCGTPERLIAWLTAAGDPSGILARLGPQVLAGRAEGDAPEEAPVVTAISA
jgi:hypothetical protein